jgi:hypothetical protein
MVHRNDGSSHSQMSAAVEVAEVVEEQLVAGMVVVVHKLVVEGTAGILVVVGKVQEAVGVEDKWVLVLDSKADLWEKGHYHPLTRIDTAHQVKQRVDAFLFSDR